MNNPYRFSKTILFILLTALFAACASDDIDISQLRQPVTMRLVGGLTQFDDSTTTRAAAWTWADGATVYLQFKNNSRTVSTRAIYTQASDDWTMPDLSGVISTSGQCEVYYFDGTPSTPLTGVTLGSGIGVYADQNGSYSYADGMITVSATLAPLTSRVRFVKPSGTDISTVSVEGIHFYTAYNAGTNTFTTSDDVITATVNTSTGYTSYIYGTYTNASTRKLTLTNSTDGSNVLFTRSFEDNVFQVGKSGTLTIPTTTDSKNWKVEDAEVKRTFIVHDYFSSDNYWTVNRYNEYYEETTGVVEAFRSTWLDTEEDLMSHRDLDQPLDRATFESIYKAQGDTSEKLYQWEAFKNQVGVWQFIPCTGNPDAASNAPESIGTIGFTRDNWTETQIFDWTVDRQQIANLALNGISQVARAVKLKSQRIDYPDMYVVFHSGNVRTNEIRVVGDLNLKDHVIHTYWYGINGKNGGDDVDEIHVYSRPPEENQDNGIVSGLNAWKPVEIGAKMRNYFMGSLSVVDGKSMLPHNWITYRYSDASGEEINERNVSLPEPLKAQNLKLDFQFDAANNNNVYRGNLRQSRDQEFLMWVNHSNYTINFSPEGYRTFKPGRVLLARKKTSTYDQIQSDFEADLQLVAYLEPSGEGYMDTQDLQDVASNYAVKLNNSIVTNEKDEYAKSLLNYRGSNQLSDDVLTARVTIVSLTDNGKCGLPLINNHFGVRFLRPVSIYKSTNPSLVDNEQGEKITIRLDDLRPSFRDFRDYWKTSPNYEKYFAPDGSTKIYVYVQGISTIGQRISENHEVLTDISLPNERKGLFEYAQPLYSVTSDMDLWLVNDNPIMFEYRNNSIIGGTFHIWIPITVGYYWGELNNYVIITVKAE